jgi:hypothetical protein
LLLLCATLTRPDGLYLGHYLSAQNQAELERLNIKFILTVGPLTPYFLRDINYKIIDIEVNFFPLSLFVSHAMQDVPDEDLLSHIPEAIRFIDEGRKQVGED